MPTGVEPDKLITIYYSYADEDRQHMLRLDKQLAALRAQGSVVTWHAGLVGLGEMADETTAAYLERAQIIVILLSPDYLATPRCYAQMERAMQRLHANEAQVLAVLLRPTTGWERTPAGQLRPLPTGSRPVISWKNYDEACANVAEGMYQAVEQLLARSRQQQADSARLRDVPPPHRHSTILPREHLVKEMYHRLTQTDLSALLLTGLGGLGKSTLAAQVYTYAEEQRLSGAGFFQQEALWLRLRPPVTMVDLATRISEARGELPRNLAHLSSQELAIELFNLLNRSDIRQLIVLDQFEDCLEMQNGHAIVRSTALNEWLDLINGNLCTSRLLITSRIRPQSRRPSRPMYCQVLPLDGFQPADGLALLQRWRIEGKTQDLVRAVERCKGHPLALVLLDAMLKNDHVSLATVLDDPGYSRLWAEDVGHNLFNDMYDRLTDLQRDTLLALSIYREAVPWRAIHAVLSALTGVTEEQTILATRVLLTQGLLQANATELYELHPLVAEFARQRFSERSGQNNGLSWPAAHAEAAHYYQRQFALHPLPIKQRSRIDDIHALIEAVWHFCQAEQWSDGYTLLEQEKLFTSLLHWGEYEVLLQIYTTFLSASGWQPAPTLAAHLYNQQGEIKKNLGQRQEALADFTRALTLSRAAGDLPEEVKALNNLGSIQRAMGQIEQALEHYKMALALSEKAQEPVEKVVTLNNLGRAWQSLGKQNEQAKTKQKQYHQALAYYEQALAIHQQERNTAEIAITLNNMGETYVELKKWDKALEHYQKALEYFRSIRDRRGEAIACNNLGAFYQKQWQQQSAFEYYVQALQIFQDIGDRWAEATTLRNLGRVFLLAQRSEVALACFLRARDIYEELRLPDRGQLPIGLQSSLANEKPLQQAIDEVRPRAAEIIAEALRQGIEFD